MLFDIKDIINSLFVFVLFLFGKMVILGDIWLLIFFILRVLIDDGGIGFVY